MKKKIEELIEKCFERNKVIEAIFISHLDSVQLIIFASGLIYTSGVPFSDKL